MLNSILSALLIQYNYTQKMIIFTAFKFYYTSSPCIQNMYDESSVQSIECTF